MGFGGASTSPSHSSPWPTSFACAQVLRPPSLHPPSLPHPASPPPPPVYILRMCTAQQLSCSQLNTLSSRWSTCPLPASLTHTSFLTPFFVCPFPLVGHRSAAQSGGLHLAGQLVDHSARHRDAAAPHRAALRKLTGSGLASEEAPFGHLGSISRPA